MEDDKDKTIAELRKTIAELRLEVEGLKSLVEKKRRDADFWGSILRGNKDKIIMIIMIIIPIVLITFLIFSLFFIKETNIKECTCPTGQVPTIEQQSTPIFIGETMQYITTNVCACLVIGRTK